MGKQLLAGFVLLAAILSVNVVSAQETAPAKTQPDSKVKVPGITIRVRARGNFSGAVTEIDREGKTLTVKNRGISVTFDVSNPELKGYRNFEQVKKGDKVAVSYTDSGATITKISAIPHLEIPMPKSEAARPRKQETAKIGKGRPMRVRERTSSVEFRDVDNNNDGKITPIELSAVIQNLTIEDFKKYDRNKDGCLSESEYGTARKSAMRNR